MRTRGVYTQCLTPSSNLPSRFYNDDNAMGTEAYGGETSYIADLPELSEEASQQVAVDVA